MSRGPQIDEVVRAAALRAFRAAAIVPSMSWKAPRLWRELLPYLREGERQRLWIAWGSVARGGPVLALDAVVLELIGTT